jgi:hypothetical protein
VQIDLVGALLGWLVSSVGISLPAALWTSVHPRGAMTLAIYRVVDQDDAPVRESLRVSDPRGGARGSDPRRSQFPTCFGRREIIVACSAEITVVLVPAIFGEFASSRNRELGLSTSVLGPVALA